MQQRFAFFDVDGTLIDFKSMISFQKYYLANKRPKCHLCGAILLLLDRLRFYIYSKRYNSREQINKKYYELFSGRSVIDVKQKVAQWYTEIKLTRRSIYIDRVFSALKSHQKAGVYPVLVSGSFMELLRPLTIELGVEYCLATKLEQRDGTYTGNILPPQMIGEGKARAIEAFIKQHDGDASRSFAYGDHSSDIPMLNTVGNPVAIKGDQKLFVHAKRMGWKII